MQHGAVSAHSTPVNLPVSILRINRVTEVTGLSRSTIYAEIKAGRFPKQVQLTSKRCVGWSAYSIEAFLQARINESSNLQ